MSKEVIIRKYKDIDYAQLCEVRDKVRVQKLIVGNVTKLYAPLEEAIYKEELFSGTTYVIEVNSHVVGLIVFGKNELGYTHMLKEYQGRGIGGELLDAAIPYLKRPAFLEVFPIDIRARGLYSSRGFVEEMKGKVILK